MSKLLFYFLIIFSVFTYAGDITITNSTRSGIEIQWQLTSYQVNYSENYARVEFPGGCGLYGVGKPALPSQQVFIEIPVDSQIYLSVENQKIEIEKINKPVAPSQEPVVDTIGAENILPREFLQDRTIYSTNALFPEKIAEIAYKGIMRGRQLALVRINPIQYNPMAQELHIYKQFTIKIKFDNMASELGQTDTGMDEIAKALISNYVPGQLQYRNEVDYLLITVPELEQQGQQLLQWKRQIGNNAKMEIIGSKSPKESIKNVISSYYPQVKFVTILGGNNYFPLPKYKKKRHPLGEKSLLLGSNPTIGSDHYFACVDGDDYYPDVYIGRIPAKNPKEAEILINKLINYQKNPPKGEWLNRFLLCGQFQYESTQNNVAKRLFCETAFTIWNSLKNKYTFPSQTIGAHMWGLGHNEYFFRKSKDINDPGKPGTFRSKIRDSQLPVVNCKMPEDWVKNIVSEGVAKQNVKAFWQEGAFLVQHRDHGSWIGWGMPSIDYKDVSRLKNGGKLPVLFSINCKTGSMNFFRDCFVESALKNPDGGAVAAIGATHSSYSWWNDRMCDGFYTCIFGTEVYDCLDEGIKFPTKHPFSQQLGVVLNFGKMYMAKNYPSNPWGKKLDYTETEFYLFHCIGDPAMQIWTNNLTELAIEKTNTDNTTQITVLAKKTRIPISNATLCFYNEKEQIVAKTDNAGICSIPDLTGNYLLTITGKNLRPYQCNIGNQ